jgi:glycerol kinase
MPGLILAIDQGTTNTKALLVARDGKPVFRASVPLPLLIPQPGFVEQDPIALWDSVLDVIRQCVAHAGSTSIEGISISNQRETAVAWHRGSGLPVANAISWQCRRSEEVCSRLADHSERIREKTGLPLDPLVSASKWSWLLQQQINLRELATTGELCLGNVDSWLVYRLTGGAVHATDYSNASRTALLDLGSLDWDNDLLALFAIPRAAMPKLLPSSGIFGEVAAVRELAGVPIVSAIGDSHAALAGHGKYRAGTVKATYGTGSSLMTLTSGNPEPTKNLARTIAWSIGDTVQFALEGNITMTGSGVQWVGEFLGLPNPTADTLALAESVADSGEVYFVPAMVGLGAPHWDSSARGTLAGLGRSSTRAHMARAAVDAIAFQVADVFHAMETAAGMQLPALHADGGATRNAALMQFQSDLLQVPVYRSACEDLSALGAAWLGGLALGWWKQISDLETLPQEAMAFKPGKTRDAHYAGWRHALMQTLSKECAK